MQSFLKSSPTFLKTISNLEQVRLYFYPIVKKKFRPQVYYSLKERLEEIDPKVNDPEIYKKVNIGDPPVRANSRQDALVRSKLIRELKNDADLEKKSRNRRLVIDLDAVEEEWTRSTRSLVVRNLAEHFQIFEHLFGPYATFEPYVSMNISFVDGDIASPVYTGNLLKPAEVPSKPEVVFASEEKEMWTLLLMNLDGNLYENDSEMVHWMVSNIPGGRVDEGEEIVSYMPPLPPKGTGFHRCVFLLYKQENKIDAGKYSLQNMSSSLESRTFKNENFYRENEDNLTAVGLSWFQADWDLSVNRALHSMDMKAPLYEYEFPAPYIAPQKYYPKGRSFNRYMDLHRPKKELQERLLLLRLSRTHPLSGDVPLLPFPQAERRTLPVDMPVWRKKDLQRQWDGEGIYRDIYRGDDRPNIDLRKQTPLPKWIAS